MISSDEILDSDLYVDIMETLNDMPLQSWEERQRIMLTPPKKLKKLFDQIPADQWDKWERQIRQHMDNCRG